VEFSVALLSSAFDAVVCGLAVWIVPDAKAALSTQPWRGMPPNL